MMMFFMIILYRFLMILMMVSCSEGLGLVDSSHNIHSYAIICICTIICIYAIICICFPTIENYLGQEDITSSRQISQTPRFHVFHGVMVIACFMVFCHL